MADCSAANSERRIDMPYLLLNLIAPFVMILVGFIFKKHPVSDMKSQNGYNTPVSRKSQAHWEYAQIIAPNIFISLGKILGIIELLLSVMMFLLHTSSQTALNVGVCVGISFLLFAFYKTDSEIEKKFIER